MNEPMLVAAVLGGLPVVVRLTAMALTMPVLAGRMVPVRVRLALVFAVAALITPTVSQGIDPDSIHSLALGMGLVHEALIGSLMGLAFNVMLAAARLAGSLIEGLCGFSMATFGVSPDEETGTGPFSRLFWWTTAAVFVAMGGIGRVVAAVMDSFAVMPAGEAVLDRSFFDFLVTAVGQSFEFGLTAVLPAIAALLVASIVLGMARSSFPQLDGIQVGLGIKAVVGMVVTSVVLLSTPWMIHGGLELTADQLQELLSRLAATAG